MINAIRRSLHTDYSIALAHRIAERSNPLNLAEVATRLFRFGLLGVAGVVLMVTMFFLARSGVIEQAHSQRLVTFFAISGLVLFAFSIVTSFAVLWDGLVSEYTRRVVTQDDLFEVAKERKDVPATPSSTAEAFALEASREEAGQELGEPVALDIDVEDRGVTISVAEPVSDPEQAQRALNVFISTMSEAGRAHRKEVRRLHDRHQQGTELASELGEVHIPIAHAESMSAEELGSFFSEFVCVLESSEKARHLSVTQRRYVKSKVQELSKEGAENSGVRASIILGLLRRADKGGAFFKRNKLVT